MTAEELVLALKDIEAPSAPPWWLVAPGYLVLAALSLGIVILIWFLIRQRKANRLALLAQQELQRIKSTYQDSEDRRRFAWELSQWLKRVSLMAFPTRQLQRYSGEAWLAFLDESLGDTHFSRGNGKIFGAEIYRRSLEFDPVELNELCERWLQAVRPQLLQQGRN